jgi:hypothetical protein
MTLGASVRQDDRCELLGRYFGNGIRIRGPMKLEILQRAVNQLFARQSWSHFCRSSAVVE